MRLDVRADCRLHDFIEECWRNDFCWQAHDPCPDGLAKPTRFRHRHPYLFELLTVVLPLLAAALALTCAALAVAGAV